MNPRLLIVPIIALLLLSCVPCGALAAKFWVADIYPEKGTTTQGITILVRMAGGEEATGTTPRYIYVFYDGSALVKAQAAPYSESTGLYTYKWDLAITVPQTASATAYGTHTVTVRLEEADGSATEKDIEYTISSGAPVGEWYKSLPSSFWATLWTTMPSSVKEELRGEKGDAGASGARGVDGRDAVVDYAALGDHIDYAALQEEIPAAKFKGDPGAAGAAGKDVDPALLYLILALGLVANAAWILPKIRGK